MGRVKTAFEKAMERVRGIEVTPEEKQALEERERVRALLADFYRGELTRDQLWARLKGASQGLLREVQLNLLDSLRLSSSPEEFELRRDGILAIEALKERQRTPVIENGLNAVERLLKEYREGKEEAVRQLREAVERNPQLRLKQVRTPDGRTVLQPVLSVDEAVQARLEEFLTEHQKRYDEVFSRVIGDLKDEL